MCVHLHVRVPTLRADQHQRQVRRVPVGGEAAEVVVNGLEADLVLQTEDEDDGVDPQRKLHSHKHNNANLNTNCLQTGSILFQCCCWVEMLLDGLHGDHFLPEQVKNKHLPNKAIIDVIELLDTNVVILKITHQHVFLQQWVNI